MDLASFLQRHGVTWPVMVGVSGGPDSWGLLLRLLDLAPSPSDVYVLHYHHDMADHGDRAYRRVRDWCDKRGIPFIAARRRPLEITGNVEAAARRRRYEFFQSAARTLGMRDLFLAHHRDDQVETVLMNVARGSGLDGLAGMEPVTTRENLRVLRPALTVPPEELQEPVSGEVPVVEDPDNRRRDRVRTLLRHELLPRWREVQPDPDSGIRSTAIHARELRTYLDRRVEERFRYWTWEDEFQLDRRRYREAPGVERRRLLRRLVDRLPGGVAGWERTHFELLDELFRTGRSGASLDLTNRLRGLREHRRLVVHRPRPPLDPGELTPEDEMNWPGLGTLRWCRNSEGNGGFPLKSFLHFTEGSLRVRSWKPGDRFPDHRGGRSLKQLFDDRRVPYRARRSWPVLTRNQEIVAVPGIHPNGETAGEAAGSWLVWLPDHPAYHQWLIRRVLL